MKITSQSLAETEQIAADFLDHLIKQPFGKGATVIGFEGDLGAGKTTFVQAIGRAFNIKDVIQSPTFVLIKNYTIPQNGKVKPCQWRRLVHIDCYRLNSGADLLKLGWRELTADAANLIFLEWPERVAEILPVELIKISFEILGETERKLIF